MKSRTLLVSAALGVVLVFRGAASAAEVVVLRGGTRIELKKPWARQGNNALLTRMDGTLLSVPVSEIDREATAVAQAAPALPPRSAAMTVPASPVEAARASREAPKARVRVTDADVGHYVESPVGAEQPGEEKPEAPSGSARLEVVDYSQERAGAQLMIRGSVRNAGGTTASSSRMTISALNAQGQVFATAEAGLSNGTIEPHRTVSFSASLPVGEENVSSLRFAPRWIAAAPPAPPQPATSIPAPAAGTERAAAPSGAAPAAGGSGAATTAASAAPVQPAARPAPASQPQTPAGQGTLWAAPPPSASFSPPADGKSGYIPGPASPDQQPKPPQ